MRRGALYLAVVTVMAACRDEPDRNRASLLSDTIAPIGTGTELLLTRERLALIDDWIHAAIARGEKAPASIADVRPPETDADRYVPLERFLRDGWGRAIEYRYTPDTRSYELRSSGEDGTMGTPDDLIRRGTG